MEQKKDTDNKPELEKALNFCELMLKSEDKRVCLHNRRLLANHLANLKSDLDSGQGEGDFGQYLDLCDAVTDMLTEHFRAIGVESYTVEDIIHIFHRPKRGPQHALDAAEHILEWLRANDLLSEDRRKAWSALWDN